MLELLLKSYLETCRKTVEIAIFENNKSLTFLCTLPLKELSGSILLELMEEKGIFIKEENGSV